MDHINKYTMQVLDEGNDKRLAYNKVCITKSGKTLYSTTLYHGEMTEDFKRARIFTRKSDAIQGKKTLLPKGEEAQEWGVLPILIKRCPVFYVTFGRDNEDNEGKPLHQYFTKVYALSYNQAIEIVKKKYKGNYQFLHRGENFDESKYPKGAYETIIQ